MPLQPSQLSTETPQQVVVSVRCLWSSDVMNDIASEMLTTSPNGDESKKYHHVVIRYEEGRHFIFAHPTKRDRY